ncbi:Carboxylesterase family [Popillia japonica]|uniref:Carboxylic ester hydrolase n=1 Tax=Popillia japonica TaxID=7064 RepID=A0AAW1I8M7_POPJA
MILYTTTLAICVLFTFIVCEDVPVIKIPAGFYGIPYAKAPVGDLRFQEPQKVPPWAGVWIANNTRLTCVQVDHVPEPPGGRYQGDEDCLYVNVFFPGKKPQTKDLLDVIVFIHGGGFMFGSMNNHGAKFLMDRDVVLVTMNYRLGVFGFLSTEDEAVPGNNGLKDQVLALEWIHNNILYFGGNPNSVTLTGLSAGAASVHFHYLSPLSRGLFHRGISMSGTALGPSKMQENALEKARIIGAHLGCTQESTKSLISCMNQRPTQEIVEAIKVLRLWLYYPYSPIAAVVETKGDNKFLTDQPWSLLATGNFHDLPWLNSVTSAEGLYPGAEFWEKDEYIVELETKWNYLIPHILDYNYTIPREQRDFISETIKKIYLANEVLSRDNFMKFINIISDRMFCISAENAATLQAERSKSEVYYYYFNYIGEEKESDTESFTGSKEKLGTAHGDDTMFVFSNPSKSKETLSKNDKEIKNILLNIWTSFAKSKCEYRKKTGFSTATRCKRKWVSSLINKYIEILYKYGTRCKTSKHL